MTSSITELLASGIKLEAHEAVAITQQLIGSLLDHDGADQVEPPYGPPSIDNVFLQEDGSVVCRGCRTTPAVSEVGQFLESLVPDGSACVPGALRYAIARARLEVDVRPFDSLHEFARDLVRHEHGARPQVVRGVLARAGAPLVSTALSRIERRRPHASVTELRRALRAAEARVFEQQRLVVVPPINVEPKRARSLSGAGACLAAGLALICTGEFMHRRQAPIVVTQAVPIVAQASAAEPEREQTARVPSTALRAGPSTPLRATDLARGIIAVRDVPSASARPARAQSRRVPVKRASPRPAASAIDRQAPPRNASRGVLDRLRLGWLRSAFAVRSDF
jgi:hypothetical protein